MWNCNQSCVRPTIQQWLKKTIPQTIFHIPKTYFQCLNTSKDAFEQWWLNGFDPSHTFTRLTAFRDLPVIISGIYSKREELYTPTALTGSGSSMSPWCIGWIQMRIFLSREHQRNKHLASHLSKLSLKVNLSSGFDSSPITVTLENISTPTFPEFSTTFSTPVLFKMRGGEDEIRPPEDILVAPLSAHLTTPLPFPFLSSSLERFVCSSPFLPFVCIFPEASFNKAVMMQIYFGWGHVCLLGLIIAQPPLSFFLLSPSSLFTGSSFDTNRIPVANEWV